MCVSLPRPSSNPTLTTSACPTLTPAPCPQFRSMWAEFEWENKVAVNTAITEPLAFLDHIIASTNMVGCACSPARLLACCRCCLVPPCLCLGAADGPSLHCA